MNGRPFDRLRANGQVNLLTDFAQGLGIKSRSWAK